MSKKLVTASLLLLGAALVTNCGDDSDSPGTGDDGGMGPGGSAMVGDAGEQSTAGTSSGATSNGGTGGVPDTGNAGAAGASELGGNTGDGGTAQGGAGGAPGPSVCPAAIEDYPGVYAEAICQKRVECCTSDADACMMEVTEALADIYPALAQAEQDGKAERNCSALEACVAAIQAAQCSAWPKELGLFYGLPVDEPACRAIIQGKLPANTACASTFECNNGYCPGGANAVCQGLVANGQTCDSNGNLCNLATSYCGPADKCVPREENGVACTDDMECESRICDTADTGKCIAPSAADCEFVPAGCSMSRGSVPGSAGWLGAVGVVLLGLTTRRRRARLAQGANRPG